MSTESPANTLESNSEQNAKLAPIEDISIERSLQDAEELKAEGNDHFRAKRWDEALCSYRSALGRLPKRIDRSRKDALPDGKGKGREIDPSTIEEEEDGPSLAEEGSLNPLSDIEIQCAKVRAVLNGNIGACFVKLEDHKEAVAACTEALKDDPQYVKALQRRAASNEQLGSWTSLASAQEDYNTLLTLLPPSSPQTREVQRSLQSLKPRLEVAQKKETDEMMGKLKGLGNSILGNFGLSTDNFQFTPNGQGGYSMNFVK